MAHKILAIDDHPETLDIVIATLQQYGFEVVGSRSSLQALSLAEKERPHLILLDRNMPEMDGTEVCRRLRAHPQLAHIPVIMFTAEGEVQQKLAGFDAGADDYLTKPTEPGELIARIEALIASRADSLTDAAAPPPVDKSNDGAPEPSVKIPRQGSAVSTPSTTVALPRQQKLVAVIGARGGSGTTTVAINLALSIAGMDYSTVLVDLDMIQGHVGLYLNRSVTDGVNALAHLASDDVEQQVHKHLVNYNNSLQLLLAKPNLYGSHPLLSGQQTAVLLETLLQSRRCVVVDLGLGISGATRPVLDLADQLIVCLRPERIGLSAAKLLLNQLQEVIFPHTSLQSIVFNINTGINLPREAIQDFLGFPLLAIIPVELKEMSRAANKGIPLVQILPQSNAASLFRRIALHLVKT